MNTQLKTHSTLFKQEGTAQTERYSASLNPENIEIDNRKLQDFILFAQQFSKNLRFVEVEGDNIEGGSWESFFKIENDEALLIANIAGRNTHNIKLKYNTLYQTFQREGSLGNFVEVVRFTSYLFNKIDRWYNACQKKSKLQQEIDLYKNSFLLTPLFDFETLIFHLKDFGYDDVLGDEIPYRIHVMVESWNSVSKDKRHSSPKTKNNIFIGNSDYEKLVSAGFVLNQIFEAVFHVFEKIITHCTENFEEIINRSKSHQPHIALLITFFKLFGHLQKEINKLPQKHLSHYYQDILHIKAKEAIPDQTYIVLELVKDFDVFGLSAGTELSAGKDKSNTELIYTLDKDFVVSKAQINTIKTVFTDKTTVSKGKKSEDKILNYYGKTIQKPFSPNDDSPWKTFGEKKIDSEVSVGFALASKQLVFTNGRREVTFTFELNNDFEKKILDFSTDILTLSLTGEKGWISTDNPKDDFVINSLKLLENKTIELKFTVSITQQSSIVGFNKKIHFDNFKTEFPVLKCVLNFPKSVDSKDYEENINQLNFLQNSAFSKAFIRSQVGSLGDEEYFDGVTNLILQNDESMALDSTKPFFPFTAIPKVGSSFYISCGEFFEKSTQNNSHAIEQNLNLNIEWNLPDKFHTYYKNYPSPYDLNNFEAKLSILKNNCWVKIKTFSLINNDSKDPRFIQFTISANELNPSKNAHKGISQYDITKIDSTLRLELVYPDFGHSSYSQIVVAATMEKSASKSDNVDYYAMVKKQLYDSIISIKLPEDIDQKNGSLKVVIYDILENIYPKSPAQAKAMMQKGLSEKLKKFNGSNFDINPTTGVISDKKTPAGNENKELINDNNFLERIFSFLKTIKIIDEDVHFDKDKQDVGDVVENIKDKISKTANFVLPANKDLVTLIIEETNNVISSTVAKAVEKIIDLKDMTGTSDELGIASILKQEFKEANRVVNDVIAKNLASNLASSNNIPPVPYTPVINSISVSYVNKIECAEGSEQFFQLTPFGLAEYNPYAVNHVLKFAEKPIRNLLFRPILTLDYRSFEPRFEQFFMGIQDLMPNQNLSILFQIAEGTRLSDMAPPPLIWQYLANNQWMKLSDENIISDSTFSLQKSGIIEFSIPSDMNNGSSLFENPDLYWLACSIQKDSNTFPMIVNVSANATAVTFKNQENDSSHFDMALPPKKIKNLVDKLPEIKKVEQPLPSFNGKREELVNSAAYFTRISEQLRHKSRAINNWDFERLVLSNFQFVYKVKCLNNYYKGKYLQGHVTVVPICDMRSKGEDALNRLIPKASYVDLIKIERLLKSKSSPFLRIHAINPQLENVLIRCKVKFKHGVDRGFYLQKLNEDLITFLTPWASEDAESVAFSSKIYLSSVINFLDERDYVDYVTDLSMNQYIVEESGENKYFNAEEGQGISLVETLVTSGHSILVSAPKHNIELIK